MHYRDPVSSLCHSAIITRVHEFAGGDDAVDLTVFPPAANPYPVELRRGGGLAGQWHWPERGDQ